MQRWTYLLCTWEGSRRGCQASTRGGAFPLCTLAVAWKRAAVVACLCRHAVPLRLINVNKTWGPDRLGSPRWLAEAVITTPTLVSRPDFMSERGRVLVLLLQLLPATWGCPGGQAPTSSGRRWVFMRMLQLLPATWGCPGNKAPPRGCPGIHGATALLQCDTAAVNTQIKCINMFKQMHGNLNLAPLRQCLLYQARRQVSQQVLPLAWHSAEVVVAVRMHEISPGLGEASTTSAGTGSECHACASCLWACRCI